MKWIIDGIPCPKYCRSTKWNSFYVKGGVGSGRDIDKVKDIFKAVDIGSLRTVELLNPTSPLEPIIWWKAGDHCSIPVAIIS